MHINKVLAVHSREEALLAAVGSQPVSVAIVADPVQNYKSGDDPISVGCSGQVDHAVLVVGYNTSEFGKLGAVDYWIVK